jgi:Zn-dependent protease with chaperone function
VESFGSKALFAEKMRRFVNFMPAVAIKKGTISEFATYICATCQRGVGRFKKRAVNKVPFGRYIAFVGSLLLAILFIADWYLPIAPTHSVTSGEADKPIIRIKSDHKWPERIVFDTSAPTIAPQMPLVVSDAPVTSPPREAFALLGAPMPEVSGTPMPVRTKRTAAKRAPHTRWAAYRPAARAEALPPGW